MKMYEIIEKLGRTERPAVSFVGAGGKTSCILELADDWAARGKRVLVTTTVHMERPEILGRTGWIDQPAENIRKALESPGVVIAGSGSETWEKIRGLSGAEYTEAASKAQAVLTEADGSRKFPVKVPGKNEPVIREDTTHILILAGASALGRPLDQVCHRLEYAKKILGPENRTLTGETLGQLLEKGYVEPLKEQYPGRKLAVILNQQDLLEEPEKMKRIIEARMSVPVFLHTKKKKKKRIHLILLAAGFSRRFGENKLLYPIKGKSMYLWTMERLKKIQKEGLADSLVVVSQYEEILKEARRQGIFGVKNPHSERGISSSLPCRSPLVPFYQKNRPQIILGTNRYAGGTNCKAHAWGSRISVVKAPSSLLRLMYPPSRSTMASMRTSPKPWPSPFVVGNSRPTFFSFFPAVKLVKEM